MNTITRDYFCDFCRRVHRIESLVGQAHKTFAELFSGSGEPSIARPSAPARAGVGSDGSPDSRERIAS